jgi:multidrug efflux pump subunit AcrB
MSDHDLTPQEPAGPVVAVVRRFLTGPLSVLVIILAATLGLMAVVGTPREEEPQIVVPMADVLVSFPGHAPAEVEQLVTTPLERLMSQIEGVEHVYSISRRDEALVTVRFYVGRDRDRAMVKVRDKIDAHLDLVPPGVEGWSVRPVEIDDVPIVTLTLFSPERNAYALRRMGEELKARLETVRNISRSEIFGGYRREVVVEPDIEGMGARGVCFKDITAALARHNTTAAAGSIVHEGATRRLVIGPVLSTAEEVAEVIVFEHDGRVVRIEDIAAVRDGPREPEHYVHVGFGPAAEGPTGRLPAVTLAFSKQRGTNAVAVARDILAEAERLRAEVLPDDVRILTTRNYGRTANEKVNELLKSMLFAVISVVGLMALAMGWREALVVGLAVPVSFALALFVNFLFGFTVNRVTLFALILSLGLVVDDPITNVDNIQRHIRMGVRDPFRATLTAVHEVIPPVVMSTLTIIVSFLPMFFITGMMGPYMGPMAVNVPLTVSFSTLCALTFVPWLSYKLLKGTAKDAPSGQPVDVTPRWIRRLYRAVVAPFLTPRRGLVLLGVVMLLVVCSGLLVLFRLVPLKMLPFDNKDELQLVLDMPEGTSLEETDRVVQELETVLATVNEVTDFESYVGVNAPIDFNGLVRHYALRRGPHQADIRINLAHKSRRKDQSHAVALRIRDDLTAIAEEYGAVLRIVEVPPGPPVLATLTVEIRGAAHLDYADLIAGADVLQARLRAEDPKHIAQIDAMAEAPHDRLRFVVNRDKAALHGLGVMELTRAVRAAVSGETSGILHAEGERTPLLIGARLPFTDRSDPDRLGELWVEGRTGLVPLAELGAFVSEREEQPIYHKNLERVVFVTAEAVGRPPGEIIWDVRNRIDENPLPEGIQDEWAGEGEWQITVRVFRDLGLAFGVAMIGIYLLLIVQMRSFAMPLIVMMAIPLTSIGIAPGFWLLNVFFEGRPGGYPAPIFFTATGMIGMIALGGIVIRNSIVLIEFIQGAQRRGEDLREAILASGAVRFRPIVLTAATTMLGAWPITLDPVFSGLAWALIFGLLASTIFTLLVVPTVYMLVGPREAPKPPDAAIA